MIRCFTIFSCQKLDSVGLSEVVIESFLDSNNFDCFTRNVKKRHQEIQS